MLRCSKADFEEVDFSCGNPTKAILKRAKLCYLGYFNKFFHIYARTFLHLPTSKAPDEGLIYILSLFFSVHKEFFYGTDLC